MQKRKHSLFESITNVTVGYGCALAGQLLVFLLFNIEVKLQDNIYIGLFFTAISIARSYILRRIFTKITEVSK
jgi:hypothetical protein